MTLTIEPPLYAERQLHGAFRMAYRISRASPSSMSSDAVCGSGGGADRDDKNFNQLTDVVESLRFAVDRLNLVEV